MSWLIKQFKNGKYGWWTTIADGYMTIPKALSKEELVEMIIAKRRKDFNKEMKELRKTFPTGWHDKDTYQQIN